MTLSFGCYAYRNCVHTRPYTDTALLRFTTRRADVCAPVCVCVCSAWCGSHRRQTSFSHGDGCAMLLTCYCSGRRD